MPSYVTPKKNAAFVFTIGLSDQTNTKALKANPTLASGDFKVSIDNGAFNNLSSLPTVTPSGGTAVQISLTSSEMNGDNIIVTAIDQAGAEWCDLLVSIQTTTRQIDDLLYSAQQVWDALTSALTTAGSIGKLLVDRIDAAISSRMATFTLPTNFSSLVIDGTGRVNAFLVGILTSVFTEGATGRIAAAFKQFFNIATPAATMDHGVLVDTVTTVTNPVTAGTVSDKTGYALTSGERTAIANEVEAQIIDETDSEKVLTAITDKIASVNPSLSGLTLAAIASQVRTELTTELARIDVAISSRLAAAGYTSPMDAAAVRAALGLAAANLDTQLAPVTHLDADISSRAAPADIDTAIASAEPIAANVKKVNDVDLAGDGSSGDKWRPA